eukprot:58014-Chlamydomonas_euryale.AAC.1
MRTQRPCPNRSFPMFVNAQTGAFISFGTLWLRQTWRPAERVEPHSCPNLTQHAAKHDYNGLRALSHTGMLQRLRFMFGKLPLNLSAPAEILLDVQNDFSNDTHMRSLCGSIVNPDCQRHSRPQPSAVNAAA